MNFENINEYVAMMSRKLVLESMTCQRMLRRSVYEKQIEYFLDLAPDIKMKLIINNPLHYFSDTNDQDTDEDEDDDDEEDDEEEGGHKFYTLSHIKNRLKNAQYDNQTVQEILDSII